MAEQIHTVAEVAEIMRISRDAVRGLIHRGELGAVSVGKGKQRGRWVIPDSALAAFIESAMTQKNA